MTRPRRHNSRKFQPMKHDVSAWRDLAKLALVHAEFGVSGDKLRAAVNRGLCHFPLGPGGDANVCKRLCEEIQAHLSPARPLNGFQRTGLGDAVPPGSKDEIKRLAELVLIRCDNEAAIGQAFNNCD